MPRHNRQGRRGEEHRWGSPRKHAREREHERDSRFSRVVWPLEAGGRAEPVIDDAALPAPVQIAAVCGRCREWFADEEGGRGTCDHPGSGFLKPWSDTPACPFFHA